MTSVPRLALAASVFVGLAATATSVHASDCPVHPTWPTAGFPRRTDETARLYADRVKALEDYAFTIEGADADHVGVRTDSVVIVHQGAIFYERHARGYTASMPHYAWSVTKSITSLLAGIAVGRGDLSMDRSVCAAIPNAPESACKITLTNLLEFASGLDWNETYEGKSNQESSVLAMLYGQGHGDMAKFVLDHPFRDEPGTSYMYSTGDSVAIAAMVDHALRPSLGDDYPWTVLFDPLGMSSATLERDGSNTHVGGSYLYASPEDYAKVGYFLLSDGCWNDARILPEGWIEEGTAVSAPFRAKPLGREPGDVQGRQFWLNRVVPGIADTLPWPDVPDDAFAALGHWGQSITVIPSRDVVVVRTADDRDKTFDLGKFLALALAVVGDAP
ncbi:MAG: serine hydrolase [Polyangiaceae bacterium]